MKTREREKARMLRRDGGSIKKIARVLGVSTSSVSLWVRDIELTPEQHRVLQLRNSIYSGQRKGAEANAKNGRTRRSAYQREGRWLARQTDPLYIAGCMLYWAEGAKARNQIAFANSDPAMVRFFAEFIRRYFDVPDTDLRLRCFLYGDHASHQLEVESFWLNLLGLPRSCLRTSVMNRYSRSSKRKRTNKLPYGTCHVIVNSTRVVQTIFGSIQEYAGFDRPEWLG